MIAHIVYRDSGAAECRFPYHGRLVDALKASIPASHRTYDPVMKAWTVSPPSPLWRTGSWSRRSATSKPSMRAATARAHRIRSAEPTPPSPRCTSCPAHRRS
jgi:hypothetical protein